MDTTQVIQVKGTPGRYTQVVLEVVNLDVPRTKEILEDAKKAGFEVHDIEVRINGHIKYLSLSDFDL